MPIIMTGSLDRFGGARNDDGRYASNSNGVGYSGNVDRRLYYAPSTGPLYEAALSDIVTLRLHMMVRKVNDDYPESHITAYFYNKKIDEDTGEEGWNYNKVTDLTYTYPENPLNQPLAIPIPPGDKSQEVEVEIPAKYVENALLYGIGLAGGTRTNASTGEEYPLDAVSVTDCYFEADVMSVEAPPGVGFDSSVMAGGYLSADGIYIHDATKRFLLGFSTSHEKGTEITSVDTVVVLGAASENEETEEVENEIPEEDIVRHAAISPLTIAPARGWGSLPAVGRLGIRARTRFAVSEWIWLPFRVAHTEILVTSHTSGMILPDNEGIALTWEHELPEGLSVAPVPDIVEIQWNRSGDAVWSGASVMEGDGYTIPVEEFSGGSVFEVRLRGVWLGSGGDVKTKDEDRVVLYFFIQSVADVSSLTVDAPWDAKMGYYPPLISLSWESVGQTAYQVMIDGAAEKVVWGSSVSHAIHRILEDGMHTAALRVQDANGIWTEWCDPVYFRVRNETEEDTVYGEAEITVHVREGKTIVGVVPMGDVEEPNYKNLADPTDEDWEVGYVFDGNDPLLDPVEGGKTTNYISVEKGDVLYIAGFDFLKGYRIACYKSDKSYWGGVNYYSIDASATFSTHFSTDGAHVGSPADPYVLTVLSSTVKYVRISGICWEAVETVIVAKSPLDNKVVPAPEFDGVMLYRNGVPIASLPANVPVEYNDVYANGAAEYLVRSVRSDGRYAQSITVSADCSAAYDRLDFPDGVSVALRTMVSFPRTYVFSETEEATSVWYRGRTFPVSMRSGRKTRSITLQYREKGTLAADLLSGRSGETAFFRDVKGGRRMVVITNLSIGRSLRWCDISITMTETDFTEEVNYER